MDDSKTQCLNPKTDVRTAQMVMIIHFIFWADRKEKEERWGWLFLPFCESLLWCSSFWTQWRFFVRGWCRGLHSLAVDPACVSIPWLTKWKTWGPLHSRPIRAPSEIIYLTSSSTINQWAALVNGRPILSMEKLLFIHSVAHSWLTPDWWFNLSLAQLMQIHSFVQQRRKSQFIQWANV